MDQQARINGLLLGLSLHPGAAVERIELRADHAALQFSDEPATCAGILSGLFCASKDDPFWTSDTGAAALKLASDWLEAHGGELGGLVGNDFFLGRFGVGGGDVELVELFRRALHRDGSTEAISAGSDLLHLFHDAWQVTPVAFEGRGLDLANVVFADRGSSTIDFADLLPGISTLPAAGTISPAESSDVAMVASNAGSDDAAAPAPAVAAPRPATKRAAAKKTILTPAQEKAKAKGPNRVTKKKA